VLARDVRTTERREVEEVVCIEYRGGLRSWGFEGVDGRGFGGGTTTQLRANSSALFRETCRLLLARGGVGSGVGFAM
jgi:hypothetical protein